MIQGLRENQDGLEKDVKVLQELYIVDIVQVIL